jgi:hypothetical protein
MLLWSCNIVIIYQQNFVIKKYKLLHQYNHCVLEIYESFIKLKLCIQI